MNKPQKRVLVVDDEIGILESIEFFLLESGFYVCSATSAEQALLLLDKQVFDVAVVDVRLPGMSGNELIIKSVKINAQMKFIICTGSTEYKIPLHLLNIGISREELFYKPITHMEKLVETINRLMSQVN
jgi:two-component system, OmpR family, response regulator